MSITFNKPLHLFGGAVVIAVLLTGAFVAGTLYPQRQADATAKPDFQVVDRNATEATAGSSTSLSLSLPDPFTRLEEVQREMDEVFNRMFSRLNTYAPAGRTGFLGSPEVDLRDEGDQYVARLDMPGIDSGSITVDVEGQTLTISGTRTAEAEHSEGTLVRKERQTGAFRRSFRLADPVDPGAVETNYEDGVVTVRIKKAV